MKINVSSLWLQNEESRIVAKVSFHQDANPPYNGGTVEVFLPMQGTVEEIKAAALVKAREVLAEAIAKLDELADG